MVKDSAKSSDIFSMVNTVFDGWILLEFKLIDWSYMDFSRVFRSSTTIHTIKEVIVNYHGGNIQKLTLCKDTYLETNELRNDRITLKECLGISGSLDKNKAPVIRICYDFLPDGCTEPDPILMY